MYKKPVFYVVSSLKERKIMAKLLVTVLGCRDLESKDTFGSSDPYVKIGCGGKSFKTKVIKNNINPNFNEQFTFLVGDPNTEQPRIQVFDEDSVNDEIIGGYAISLQGLERGVKKEQCASQARLSWISSSQLYSKKDFFTP